MSSPSPVEPKEGSTSLPGRSNPVSRRWHPAVPAVLSALFFWLAFPPADRGYFGWVALAPLFLLVGSDRSPFALYFGAWVGGLTFGLLSMSWVAEADVVGMGFMALFMSLWWPLFLLPTRVGVRRLGLPLMLIAPIVWVGLEFARAHILSGFPWYYLAHTQHRYLPLIQVSDLAGAWGLSLILAVINAWWVDLLTTPLLATGPNGPSLRRPHKVRLTVVVLLLAATLGYGGVRLSRANFREGPRLALIQTDFPQALKNGPRMEEVLATLDRLVARAVTASPRPDMIVWPETSYPIGVIRIDPTVSESGLGAQGRQIDPQSNPIDWRDRKSRSDLELHSLADAANIPMLIGTTTYEFAVTGQSRYNSAVLYQPRKGETASYHKQSLVPFGEYIPFVRAMPWLLKFTPYTDGYVPSLSPGGGPRVMETGGIRYAPVICFEDTVPHVVRAAILGDGREPPSDVLLNLTNDGWFRGTAEHQAHLAICVFRAVECRTPMARSVNTGISALIDGDGRILATQGRETSGVLQVAVPLDDRDSLYLRTGDWLPRIALAIAIGVVPLGRFRPRQSAFLAHPPSVG